jgi:hypothetical protein
VSDLRQHVARGAHHEQGAGTSRRGPGGVPQYRPGVTAGPRAAEGKRSASSSHYANRSQVTRENPGRIVLVRPEPVPDAPGAWERDDHTPLRRERMPAVKARTPPGCSPSSTRFRFSGPLAGLVRVGTRRVTGLFLTGPSPGEIRAGLPLRSASTYWCGLDGRTRRAGDGDRSLPPFAYGPSAWRNVRKAATWPAGRGAGGGGLRNRCPPGGAPAPRLGRRHLRLRNPRRTLFDKSTHREFVALRERLALNDEQGVWW